MTGLLEDLDSIYKIESGALNPDPEPTDIVELCSDCLLYTSPSPRDRG